MKSDIQAKTGANEKEWKDWKWQHRNMLRSASQIRRFFPNFPEEDIKIIAQYESRFRFGITPYLVNLIEVDEKVNPRTGDPIYQQFFPDPGRLIAQSKDAYDADFMNWEMDEEIINPQIHHKYTDRVAHRTSNCLSYCNYCFEVHRTMDKEDTKKKNINGAQSHWQGFLDYVKAHNELREVLFTGGEPLVMPNETLEERLHAVREIPHIRSIRFNTRVLTHNPFRVDDQLVELMKKYGVTEMGVHITHPREITPEFKEAVNRFDQHQYDVLMLAQIPLLRGINDNREILEELLVRLYSECHIKPYYFLHDMPWTLGTNTFRTTVKKGVDLIKPMKRHVSNVAMPEYIIVHHEGKHTVPLEYNDFWLDENSIKDVQVNYFGKTRPLSDFAKQRTGNYYLFHGTPEFIYAEMDNHPVIAFKNWKGRWETYLDGKSLS
jgi:lysine 2,3-aminomutase